MIVYSTLNLVLDIPAALIGEKRQTKVEYWSVSQSFEDNPIAGSVISYIYKLVEREPQFLMLNNF